ncbi:glycine zipper family protein [Tropicimonas sp. S265A]|uniref:glycine zipper family protein n=1 Tax=Tropicimonas sp. S265A TaxID=3415134 RepID=UPI003C7D0C58
MIHAKYMALLATAALMSACANSGANYVPVIDGAVGPNFNSDLAQCQNLAASQSVVDGRTAGSAATGAAVAGASSVIFNDNSDNLGRAAAVGALAGATGSAIQNNANREAIVRNCMRGRGYNVVG